MLGLGYFANGDVNLKSVHRDSGRGLKFNEYSSNGKIVAQYDRISYSKDGNKMTFISDRIKTGTRIKDTKTINCEKDE